MDGYSVTLNTGGPVTTGKPATMSYTISKDGKPVSDLTPYLGAMGHLVIISQDLRIHAAIRTSTPRATTTTPRRGTAT